MYLTNKRKKNFDYEYTKKETLDRFPSSFSNKISCLGSVCNKH